MANSSTPELTTNLMTTTPEMSVRLTRLEHRLEQLMGKQSNDTIASNAVDEILKVNMNNFFLIFNAIIVFIVQAGFAYLECGSVRSKNATNILIKNILDALFGALSYWLFGYAFSYGDAEHTNAFIGYAHFAGHAMEDLWSEWFFQFVFAATAATIVSGAVAERCSFIAYFVYSLFITGFIYPVVVHWGWTSEGWLSANGYADFAGSGIVHLLGGVAALSGAGFLGPRIGRFTSGMFDLDKHAAAKGGKIEGHSVPLAALGGFLLILGFFSFNGGSLLSIVNQGEGATFGKIVSNTMFAGASSGVVALVLNKISFKGQPTGKFSILVTINGILSGLVSICYGCDKVYAWGAVIIGAFAGPVMMFCSWAVAKVKIDDPLDAFAVHGGGGIVGLLLTPFFWQEKGLFWGNPGGEAGVMLGMNIAALLVISLWTGGLCSIMFGILKVLKMLRVDRQTEIVGMDIVKHGEPAYPVSAYGGDYRHLHDSNNKSKVEMVAQNGVPIVMPSIGSFTPSRGKVNETFAPDDAAMTPVDTVKV